MEFYRRVLFRTMRAWSRSEILMFSRILFAVETPTLNRSHASGMRFDRRIKKPAKGAVTPEKAGNLQAFSITRKVVFTMENNATDFTRIVKGAMDSVNTPLFGSVYTRQQIIDTLDLTDHAYSKLVQQGLRVCTIAGKDYVHKDELSRFVLESSKTKGGD